MAPLPRGFFLALSGGTLPTAAIHFQLGRRWGRVSERRPAASLRALVYPFKDADHRTKKNPAGCLGLCGRGFSSGGRLPCRIGGAGTDAPNRSLPREHKPRLCRATAWLICSRCCAPPQPVSQSASAVAITRHVAAYSCRLYRTLPSLLRW